MWAAGMAWLVSAAPAERRGELIGSALGAAIVGVLFGPVLGGAATVVGQEVVFSGVSVVAVGAGGLGLDDARRAARAEPGRAGGAARAARAATCWPASGCSRCRPCSRARSRCWCRCAWTTWARAAPPIGAIFLVAAGVRGDDQPHGRPPVRPARSARADPHRAGRRGRDGRAAAAAADVVLLLAAALVAGDRRAGHVLGARHGAAVRRLGAGRARPGARVLDREPGLGARPRARRRRGRRARGRDIGRARLRRCSAAPARSRSPA